MFKKSALVLLALSLPLTASANWSLGGGYINLSDDSNDSDISLGGIYGSAAYIVKTENENFTVIPELRLGTGISDDSVDFYYGDIDIELESFIALSLRAQYQVNERFYLYAMPSYANAELKASGFGESETDDEWEFGFGAGAGFTITEDVSLNFSYELYDDTDVITAGISVNF